MVHIKYLLHGVINDITQNIWLHSQVDLLMDILNIIKNVLNSNTM